MIIINAVQNSFQISFFCLYCFLACHGYDCCISINSHISESIPVIHILDYLEESDIKVSEIVVGGGNLSKVQDLNKL